MKTEFKSATDMALRHISKHVAKKAKSHPSAKTQPLSWVIGELFVSSSKLNTVENRRLNRDLGI
jgi:hypothetical protein